ncbi:hypothetical protein CDL12_08445 [Handroanthus impetiginosus]|uniref:HTH myb-type domain-containing protein n=1 Tax=Handroanthus impetiginosus TaxID=429701 RepID=A0A2G9HMY6_9LAMI|nr:hypothetical protein CDL12_08445 [Handroanthus impetiginosus]
MQLLTYVMGATRQELQSQMPVLEEFIPLKNTSSSEVTENQGNVSSDKADWMTSVQLWNQETEEGKPSQTSDPTESTDINLGPNSYQRINGGTAFPELTLASSHKEDVQDNKNSSETISRRDNSEKVQACGTANSTQIHRKARRCWSPDLHRRFVNALQMLGGSHVATPKQIRELMKVDGLTNDEVKSHLQKYRLHTRSPQAAATTAPQLFVLGGIWVPPEYAAEAAHGGEPAAAWYGAHAAATHQISPPFSSAAPPVPREIYPYHAIGRPPPPPKHQLHHQPINRHGFHLYNKPPLTHIQGGAGNPSESIEDDKSESGSWKADSGGENGAKRLEAEESNAKFVSFNY